MLNSFLGLPVAGVEKKINSLMRRMESCKGRGIKVVGGKRKSFLAAHLEREMRKLEWPINYNCSPLLVRGKGRGAAGS